MLKVAFSQEEREGAALMTWWNADGAARVLAHDATALLLERAQGTRSLATMSSTGRDGEACEILCATVGRLHRPRPEAAPRTLAPLPIWFRQLEPAAAKQYPSGEGRLPWLGAGRDAVLLRSSLTAWIAAQHADQPDHRSGATPVVE